MRRRVSSGGRPLRFLAVTLGGWTVVRVALLWPVEVIPAGPLSAEPPKIAGMSDVDAGRWFTASVEREVVAPWPLRQPWPREAAMASFARQTASSPGHDSPLFATTRAVTLEHDGMVAPGQGRADQGAITPPLRPVSIAQGKSRLAGSAWGIARGGSNGTLLGGQLGASQAGARLTYAVGEARRIALSVRIATPLSGLGKEAAFGLDWQPTHLPLHLLAEQRVSLDGQRGGPTVLVVGGINPTPILAGFRLEGYGQAGAIKRDDVEAFGDGAARLTHKLAIIGSARIDLGGGMWGAAQRGARRLDIGPTIGAVVPVTNKTLRITLDWRERIGGNARPGSGPALSIGTDF